MSTFVGLGFIDLNLGRKTISDSRGRQRRLVKDKSLYKLVKNGRFWNIMVPKSRIRSISNYQDITSRYQNMSRITLCLQIPKSSQSVSHSVSNAKNRGEEGPNGRGLMGVW